MDIGFSGDGAIGEAVAAGLRGLDITPTSPHEASPLVVGGDLDADDFDTADSHTEGPWIAVQVGGIGGHVLDGIRASVSVLHPEGPCYTCLERRVGAATASAGDATPAPTYSARFAGAIAGRILQETDALKDAIGSISIIGAEDATVLPVPGCRCDDDGSRFEPPGERSEPDSAVLERAEQAVDSRVGVITQVGEQSSFPAPYYVAQVADTTAISDVQAARFGGGVDLEWNTAFMRAIGEGLERYSAGMYRLSTLPTTASDEAISLEEIQTAHEDAEPSGHWWPAVDLHTGNTVDLPAEVVVFPPPDGTEVDAITTGLGLGETWTEAVLAGITEVIERDACMLGWYSTFEPIKLLVNHDSYRTLVRRMAGEGLATTSLLMTQDIDIPVVTAVVHRRDSEGDPILEVPFSDHDDWPAFAVGSAADLDPNLAAERALSEAIQNWVELREMGPEQAKEEGAIAEYATFPRKARSFIEVGPSVDTDDIAPGEKPDPAATLELILDELAQVDLSAYAARTTTRDLETLGFEAVRIVIPAAQPIVHKRDHFTERLRSVPRALGFQPRLDRGDHPYP